VPRIWGCLEVQLASLRSKCLGRSGVQGGKLTEGHEESSARSKHWGGEWAWVSNNKQVLLERWALLTTAWCLSLAVLWGLAHSSPLAYPTGYGGWTLVAAAVPRLFVALFAGEMGWRSRRWWVWLLSWGAAFLRYGLGSLSMEPQKDNTHSQPPVLCRWQWTCKIFPSTAPRSAGTFQPQGLLLSLELPLTVGHLARFEQVQHSVLVCGRNLALQECTAGAHRMVGLGISYWEVFCHLGLTGLKCHQLTYLTAHFFQRSRYSWVMAFHNNLCLTFSREMKPSYTCRITSCCVLESMSHTCSEPSFLA
jgi:hypothetical protein